MADEGAGKKSTAREPEMRLVVVSNRLPIALRREEGKWVVRPGTGGLVTAIAPVLRDRGGVWIGWSGATGDDAELASALGAASREAGYRLHAVPLTEDEVKGFYYGFSNEIVWPLFHGFEARCNFVPEYWRTYAEVNRRFARVVAQQSRESDYVWVHDYQLVLVAHALRAMGAERKTGFFLHIPFPPPDTFMKLPWRAQLLEALLAYDLVGFQTSASRRNFIQCLRYLRHPGLQLKGRGPHAMASLGGRRVRIGSFPISIDFRDFARRAASETVAKLSWYFHEALPERQIILGIDRLDYTKGIPERLDAYRNALARFPEMRGKVSLVQVVVPSREEVPEYQSLKARVERAIGEINGRFSCPGWVPVQYFYRSLTREDVVAYYRAAEIALVTPLKDGMNLVAKEYCACNLEEKGVLVLSEFAGAAAELHRGAIMVNPHDTEGMAEAIRQAFAMGHEERRARMRGMRRHVRRWDIFRWADSFLEVAFSRRLKNFPPLEEYVPETSLSDNIMWGV